MTNEKPANKKLDELKKYLELLLKVASVTVPGISIALPIKDLINPKPLDKRIQRLSTLKTDLQDSIQAIEELEVEAREKIVELAKLEESINQLTEDKESAETLLQIPSDSLGRILAKAEKKSRVIGIIIGFLSGVASSYLVWLITN